MSVLAKHAERIFIGYSVLQSHMSHLAIRLKRRVLNNNNRRHRTSRVTIIVTIDRTSISGRENQQLMLIDDLQRRARYYL